MPARNDLTVIFASFVMKMKESQFKSVVMMVVVVVVVLVVVGYMTWELTWELSTKGVDGSIS